MKNLFLIVLLCIGYTAYAQNGGNSNKYFKSIYALKANDQYIDVNTGHAAPVIYDFNKDGVDDLLVGEFGKETCEGIGRKYTQGRCRLYINYGTDEKPIYRDCQWLSVDDVPIYVPVTCCISFVPRFADLNGDGIDDLLSGSHHGEIYFWEGTGNQKFKPGVMLCDATGDTIRPADSMTADPIDWDNDGDIDLLVSSRMKGAFLVENTGTAQNFKLSKPVPVEVEGCLQKKISYFLPKDWDKDGLFDLVCATEYGNLLWYRNIGTPGHPKFEYVENLWSNNVDGRRSEMAPLGYRVKLWMHDYDGDGKEDLLAGDVNYIDRVIKKLTPKEQKLKKKYEIQMYDLKKKMRNPDMEELKKKNMSVTKYRVELIHKNHRLYKNYNKLIACTSKHETHGYVWVLLRK